MLLNTRSAHYLITHALSSDLKSLFLTAEREHKTQYLTTFHEVTFEAETVFLDLQKIIFYFYNWNFNF